jgi:GNAT superfamily N-acetyltransferase
MDVRLDQNAGLRSATASDEPLPRTVALRDGTLIVLRLAEPDDAPLLDRGFESLSPASRYTRFFTAMRRLPPSVRDGLLDVDDADRVAVVAVTPANEPAGVARYFRDAEAPSRAELAVVVVDAFQGKGLGRYLVGSLLAQASSHGIETMTAVSMRTNESLRRLLVSFGATGHPVDDDPTLTEFVMPTR